MNLNVIEFVDQVWVEPETAKENRLVWFGKFFHDLKIFFTFFVKYCKRYGLKVYKA